MFGHNVTIRFWHSFRAEFIRSTNWHYYRHCLHRRLGKSLYGYRIQRKSEFGFSASLAEVGICYTSDGGKLFAVFEHVAVFIS